jgi:2-polyprenyl-6-hydroxyphenyl methylase/3-demethylubiquinone-9 3-methyltransferase
MIADGLELGTAAGGYKDEVARGERFAFGRNWQRFLAMLDAERVRQAEASLSAKLGQQHLQGRRFLDIGCGSGIFSLAARRLGARVHSFDFDRESVACATELRQRFFAVDPGWNVEQGSVLDPAYMRSIGLFDIVYSWGVLHHTGRMWEAIAAACDAVAEKGTLFIAIYNDLGTRTKRWRAIKRTYNALPAIARPLLTIATIAPEELKSFARSVVTGRPMDFVRRWTSYNDRGMNHWRDAVDWVGGYPYEYATPEAVFDFCRARGFTLVKIKCGGVGLGCNEFVFERT